MHAAIADAAVRSCPSALGLDAPPPPPEPCTPAELRALVLGGWNESDACETVLAQVARVEGSLDLAIGDGLAAMTVGDRLISRGFSKVALVLKAAFRAVRAVQGCGDFGRTFAAVATA